MSPRQRADQTLVARGLFESRAKAQEAIEAGLVTADGVVVRKASEGIASSAKIVDSLGWQVDGIVASPILGGEGNAEFLLAAHLG